VCVRFLWEITDCRPLEARSGSNAKGGTEFMEEQIKPLMSIAKSK